MFYRLIYIPFFNLFLSLFLSFSVIGTPNSHDPSADAMQGFQLLFGHLQTPRGAGGSARSRGGRRGAGSRGPRTPRGGRGAAKAAMAAMLAAASATPPADLVGSFADLTAAEEAAKSQLLDALQQQQEQLLQQQMPLSPVGAAMVDVTPKPRGRGRGTRGTSGMASRRKGVRGSAKAGRGRKALELESPMLLGVGGGGGNAASELHSGPTVPGDSKNNAIFMTPMAGGLVSCWDEFVDFGACKNRRHQLTLRRLASSGFEIKPSARGRRAIG